MTFADYAYYLQRAQDEQRCADRSTCAEQRQAHEQLRMLYVAQCNRLKAQSPSADRVNGAP